MMLAGHRNGRHTMTLRSGDVEQAMNAIGYSHGRHEDQLQRVRDFEKVVKGRNFITERRAGMYRLKAKPYVILEVSLGEFMGDDLIGLTLVDSSQRSSPDDLNGCVHSLDELQARVRELEAHYGA
jgi:hypothetical protein